LAARSFLAHHPELQGFLLLLDGEPHDAAAFTEGHVVSLSDLDLRHARVARSQIQCVRVF
jgi:hypothetical protein